MRLFSLLLLSCILLTSEAISQHKTKIQGLGNEIMSPQAEEPGELFEVALKNRSFKPLEVEIINTSTQDKTGGFGLGRKGKVEVQLNTQQSLRVINPHKRSKHVDVTIKSIENPAPIESKDTYINLTLRNETARDIPLIIPGVMNPNLSPFGNSGVSLKIGQEILFREKGKRYVLLSVDAGISPDSVLLIGQLLKERRIALGLL